MAEVAGLAIGTASFITQLFELTVKSYHALYEPQKAERSFDSLDAQLAVEKQRLIEWGNAAIEHLKPGDQSESSYSCLTDSIARTLKEITSNLRRIASIREKYVPKIEPATGSSRKRYSSLLQIEELFHVLKSKGAELDHGHSSSVDTNSLMTKLTFSKRKRLKWAMKDAASVECIISELRRANDSLFSLLPAVLRESAEQAARASVLVESDDQSMKAIAKLDQPQYKDVAAAMQIRQAVVEDNQDSNTPESSVDEFSESQILLEESGYVRSLATLKGADKKEHQPDRTVLVEWKRTAAEGFSMDRQRRLMRLLQQNTVPLAFRALHCLGSFRANQDQHDEVLGILFEIPSGTTSNIDLITLHDTISAPKKKKPPLGDRFHLAYVLANAVHELHASSWLHKNIRSANVLFFQEHTSTTVSATNGTTLPNRDPFLVGFDYARPAGTQELSENPELAALQVDLYHHPAYQIGSGERYRPFFDVYSLGIVLLEIGAWRSIHTFQKQGQTIEEFRQRLLQHLVPQLGPEMGTIYQGAVATCLSDVLDDGAHLVTQPYQTRFRRRVVDELRKCRA